MVDASDAGDMGRKPGVTCVFEIRWIDPGTDTMVELPTIAIEDGAPTATL